MVIKLGKIFLLLIIGFIVGLIYTTAYPLFQSFPPAKDDIFIKACAKLNGEELTFSQIERLNGTCYVRPAPQTVGVKHCTSALIDEALGTRPNERLHIFEGSKFMISQGPLENSWRCEIDVKDKKIKAIPYFSYNDEDLGFLIRSIFGQYK